MSDGLLFVVIVAASFRLWRFVGADTFRPLAWLRSLLARLLPVWLYEGVECGWCSGSWVAFGVVFAVDRWYRPLALPVLWALGAATAVGLIGANLDD